ncbi:MAG: Rab family GTPase [Candidatus Heimdallarchaeota archaeon]
MLKTKRLKLGVLGEGGVGKTTFVRTFKEGAFSESTMTIAVEYHVKRASVDNQTVLFLIWDLGGQDHFKKMRLFGRYLEGAQAAAVCFDLTDLDTLHPLAEWLKILPYNIPKILVGLKADLLGDVMVDPTFDRLEIEEFMKKHSLEHFYATSAKNPESVTNAFQDLALIALNTPETSDFPLIQ